MFRRLIEKYKQTTDLNRFLIKGAILFLAWRVFRKWMLLNAEYSSFTQAVSIIYLKTSRFFLTVFGFDTHVNFEERKLWLTGAKESIEIVYDCLGVNLFAVFLVFMLAYPGKVSLKSIFIPVGFLLIFLLNAFRMAALTYIVAHWPEKMDLFHHFIFQGIIYIGIFLIWFAFIRIGKTKCNFNK
ncbi:MAG: archaeosortase/exosortase family protein [Prolixibacteraceae bacterium]|nr:archaeosortase/exosortase family protein [Prolixibacteraceae bacterium]